MTPRCIKLYIGKLEAPFMKKSNNIEVGFRKSVAYKKSVYISNLQLIPREEVESYVFTDVLA